jgi:hypothetical protein
LYIFLSASLVTLLHRRAGRRGGWGRETYPNVYYLHTYTHTHSIQGVVLFAFVRVFMYSLLLALCLLLFWDILITQSIVLASTGAALQDKLLLYCRLLL